MTWTRRTGTNRIRSGTPRSAWLAGHGHPQLPSEPGARGRAGHLAWRRGGGLFAASRRGLSRRPRRRGHSYRKGLALRARAAPASAPVTKAPRYQLRSGVPDLSFSPRRAWQQALAAALRELPDTAFGYGPRLGLRRLRVALSDYLGRVRAVVSDPERMAITAGAGHGLEILWHTLRRRGGRRVAVEDPAWAAIPATVAQAGLDVVPIAVDEEGLNVAQLDTAGADAVVLSPAHQYPTGVVLSPGVGPSRSAGRAAARGSSSRMTTTRNIATTAIRSPHCKGWRPIASRMWEPPARPWRRVSGSAGCSRRIDSSGGSPRSMASPARCRPCSRRRLTPCCWRAES